MALSQDQNDRLTQVGPGTPGGDLMRRYWHPVAVEAQLDEDPVQKVRILGEDLILYRDRSGRIGLIEPQCAHRMVDMIFGIPEDRGLRCPYHGWCYDETGQCIETPLEAPNSRLKESVRLRAYPVEALGGLVFAYLGPQPAPVLPRWDLFVREDGFRQILSHHLPCNWLQVMENRGDHGHATYLHGRLFQYVLERKGQLSDDPKLLYNRIMNKQAERLRRGVYERFRPIHNEFGFTKARLDFDEDESSENWQIGTNPILFPYQLAFGPSISLRGRHTYQLGVPIDDTHTWHITYDCFVFPPEVKMRHQDTVPWAEVPLTERDGSFLLDHIHAQDMVAWHAQGAVADRTRERLGGSDVCVVAYRDLLEEQIARVERGEEPMNVFRDDVRAERPERRIPGFSEGEMSWQSTRNAATGGGVARGYYHEYSPSGWLYIDEDVERYCPDREEIVAAYARLRELEEAGLA